MQKQTYTTNDLHKLTGLSPYTIRRHVRTRIFPIKPINKGCRGRDYLFSKTQVDKWLGIEG